MAKPLTPITIAKLRPRRERFEISDGGCHGLAVCVFPSGRRSFVVRYRDVAGRPVKLTLGPCLTGRDVAEPVTTPEAGTPLSLAAARELCTRALREAKSGNDPAAAKRQKREEQRAAGADTLQALSEEFLRREGDKLRTADQRRSDLELACETLGRLPVAQITRGMFVRALDRIADERGPVRADRVLGALSRLLTWHAHRSDYVSPLVRGMRRTSIKDRARSRVLTDDELARIWKAAESLSVFGPYVQFMLLTATRRGEAAGLRRSELSDGGTTWIIPGSRYKNGQDTLVPLSAAAQKIIAAQPVLGDFVFSVTGARELTGFTERKAELDAASNTSAWRLHDTRRTGRTLLSRAGISADIAEMCLGHALTGVRNVYDRHAYEAEKRHAFEVLAAQIARIVSGPEPKVADFAAERGRRRRP